MNGRRASKRMRKALFCGLLLALAVCLLLPAAYADDNATTGDGDTHSAASGYGWYREKEYLWKVSLYAGKADTSSRTDPLSDFHFLGDVYLKNTNWTVSSVTRFGCATKAEYLSGTPLAPATGVSIYALENCPAVPIACSKGDLDTVKSFFGSTGTAAFLLNAVADANKTTADALLAGLTCTIGNVTKSGWDLSYLRPDGENNRIPWAVIYEPVIVMRLKDGKTRVAFTATEYALAQLNGWYDWHKSGGKGQWVDNLTHKHLPTSVVLEESWFGYPVYPPTDGKTAWADEDIVNGGGWGMRFLPVSVWETPAVDYDVTAASAGVLTVGEEASVTVRFRNLLENAGTTLCRVKLDGKLLYSRRKTIAGRGELAVTVKVTLNDTDAHTLLADVHSDKLDEDLTPENNKLTLKLYAKEDDRPKPEFSCLLEGDEAEADGKGSVWVTWTNAGGTSAPVLCELYAGGEGTNCRVYAETCTLEPGTAVTDCLFYPVYGSEPLELIARIRYADRADEKDPEDNESRTWVFPTVRDTAIWDFSAVSITLSDPEIPSGGTLTAVFRTENKSPSPQTDIPVELLLNGTVIGTWLTDYAPNGSNTRTASFPVTESGLCLIAVRVNWAGRRLEDNPSDNLVTAQATVLSTVDFAVTAMVGQETVETGETMTVFFDAENRSPDEGFTAVPVELLEGDTPVWSQELDFGPGECFTLRVTYPSPGTETGYFPVTARIRWEDRFTESDPDNNSLTVYAERVAPAADVLLEAVTPNASYLAGSEVITTFRLYNETSVPLTDTRPGSVRLTVQSGSGQTVYTAVRTDVVCPSDGANLIWFRWTVPDSCAGRTVVCTAVLTGTGNAPNGRSDTDTASLTVAVRAPEEADTPDTRYERIRPTGWTDGTDTYPAAGAQSAYWEEWTCANGTFTRLTRTVNPTLGDVRAVPDPKAFSAVRTGDRQWYLPSGYGFSLSFDPAVYYAACPEGVTGYQSANVYYPEYGYGSRVLHTSLTAGEDGLFTLPGAEGLHFLPLWMPDGLYRILVCASDCWTPAGMLSGKCVCSDLTVSHSAYDGWYLGTGGNG